MPNYAALKVAFNKWMDNPIEDDIPADILVTAQDMMDRDIRVAQQITDAQLTGRVVDAATDSTKITLPDDYLDIVDMFAPGTDIVFKQQAVRHQTTQSQRLTLASANPKVLTYRIVGEPAHQIILYGQPLDASTTLALAYYAKFPRITTDPASDNWLLRNAFDIVLRAVLATAREAEQDFEAMQAHLAVYTPAYEKLNKKSITARTNLGYLSLVNPVPSHVQVI